MDTRAAAIGHEARADLARQLQEAATVEALAKARQEIEAEAWCGGWALLITPNPLMWGRTAWPAAP